MKRIYSGVFCINQYPQTKPETCWLELQKDALSLRIRYTDETGTFSHKTSIHNHWTVSYHYKSSLRVCSIESMIVIRSFKMAHLRKNKSTFSLTLIFYSVSFSFTPTISMSLHLHLLSIKMVEHFDKENYDVILQKIPSDIWFYLSEII